MTEDTATEAKEKAQADFARGTCRPPHSGDPAAMDAYNGTWDELEQPLREPGTPETDSRGHLRDCGGPGCGASCSCLCHAFEN